MNHRDVDMSDVVIVLDDLDDAQTQVVVDRLKGLGMSVSSVDNDNSVVEGNIDTCKVHDLRKIEHVRYVRPVFSYTAELPCPDGEPDETDEDSDD